MSSGSTNSVPPDDDVSCTMPLISPLCSALTGMTNRPLRTVTSPSRKYFEYEPEV